MAYPRYSATVSSQNLIVSGLRISSVVGVTEQSNLTLPQHCSGTVKIGYKEHDRVKFREKNMKYYKKKPRIYTNNSIFVKCTK